MRMVWRRRSGGFLFERMRWGSARWWSPPRDPTRWSEMIVHCRCVSTVLCDKLAFNLALLKDAARARTAQTRLPDTNEHTDT